MKVCRRAWARRVVACAVAWGMVGVVLAATATAAAGKRPPPAPEAPQGLSAAAGEVVRHALVGGDARGRPFAVVDKLRAQMFVFDGAGRLVGTAPALLGLTPGDQAFPGFGPQGGNIPPHERTTPAGRFESFPGRNHVGEAVVWIDYASSLAIHRLRPPPTHERRPQRLASPTPRDNRISLGCVVVEAAFYDAVVAPTLGRSRGVVYILPEQADTVVPWLAADTTAH